MKKWRIGALVLGILVAGAVSVSAAVDTTGLNADKQDAVCNAVLQGCDGIPDCDGSGNPYRETVDTASPAENTEDDPTPNDDCIPDQDSTGNQYRRAGQTNISGDSCPNRGTTNPDCDGIPDRDGCRNQYRVGNQGNGNRKGW